MKNNSIFKHLKSEQYYNDLYDSFTIEKCRKTEKDFSRVEYKPKIKGSKKTKGKEPKTILDLSSFFLYFIKGDRYLHKAGRIKEWMDRDRAKDELLAIAEPPEVQCLKCGSDLIPDHKQLYSEWPEEEDKVLFMYDCPNKCLPRRAFFNNGEEWIPKPFLCPKCNSKTEMRDEKKGNTITTTYICSNCDYKEEDVLVLDKKAESEKPDPNFEKDRKRFCLSYEEGQEYIADKKRLEDLSKTFEELKEKEKIKKAISGIKKLNIAQLQELLVPILEKEGYTNLDFAKPEIERNIIISFSVQDNRTNREEYDSKIQLQRLLKTSLEKINWRLMSEGVSYQLGVLNGRLRGFELEEDLLKLTKKKE